MTSLGKFAVLKVADVDAWCVEPASAARPADTNEGNPCFVVSQYFLGYYLEVATREFELSFEELDHFWEAAADAGEGATSRKWYGKSSQT